MWILLACRDPSPGTPPDAPGPPAPTTPAPTEPPARRCGLRAEVTPPFPQEGDAVHVALSCADAPLALGFANPPPGAAVAADGATLDLVTGLDDAGVYEIVATASGGAPLPETTLVRFSVADRWEDPDNVPVDPATYREEWGLPVLHLLPSGPLGQEYVDGDAVWGGVTTPIGVKIRGAASAGYPKPSLTIESRGPEKLDLSDQGLGRRDHLVLISNFDDNGHLRQKLVYDLWADLAADADPPRITPRTFFVVVYLDGAYQGLFTAVDRVDDELLRDMGLGDGEGNLYKAVSHDANFYATGAYGAKATWHDGYTKEQGDPPDDFTDLDALVRWSAEATDDAFARDAEARLPLAEFLDWWALVVFSQAGDSGGKNAYLYDDPATGRFRYVPWDFNHAYGQDWMTLRTSPEAFDDFTWTNGIFAHVLGEPGLHARLADRWAELVAGPLSAEAQLARIDALDALTAAEARRDEAKWRDAYRSYWWAPYRGGDWTTRDEEVAYVRDWTARRAAWAAGLAP